MTTEAANMRPTPWHDQDDIDVPYCYACNYRHPNRCVPDANATHLTEEPAAEYGRISWEAIKALDPIVAGDRIRLNGAPMTVLLVQWAATERPTLRVVNTDGIVRYVTSDDVVELDTEQLDYVSSVPCGCEICKRERRY